MCSRAYIYFTRNGKLKKAISSFTACSKMEKITFPQMLFGAGLNTRSRLPKNLEIPHTFFLDKG
jgi:hypothetical protein